MTVLDNPPLDETKTLGSGKLAPDEVAHLYARAFAEFGVFALWSRKPSSRPTVTQALTVADALRAEGNLRARALAVEVEAARRAALRFGERRRQAEGGASSCYDAGMSAETDQMESLASLYRRAFAEFGRRALWNLRPVADPSAGEALAITQALRTHGRMEGRRLAEQIEKLCRAAE